MDRPDARMIDRVRRPWVALLAVAVAISIATLPVVVASASGGGGAPPPAAATLPPDWPADLPLPPGQIQASTGSAGQWTVELLVNAGAAEAHKAAVDFYVAHGFRAQTDSIVTNAAHRITVVVENRDHSPNQTFVLIAVSPAAPAGSAPPAPVASTPPAAAAGRVVLRATLSGHGRATVVLASGRACWRFAALRGIGRPRAAVIARVPSGRVVLRLGRRFRAAGCAPVSAGVARAIAARPGRFAVRVTTRRAPSGAARGRLRR